MRNVPAELQAHLDSGTTTVTLLMLIEPVSPGYAKVGITMLDQDVAYDDGAGLVTYSAAVGMVPANLLSSLDMSVDNTEFKSLLPEFNLPIKEADIVAGVYNYATCTIYLVNYNDLTAGRHVVLGYGNTGQMRIENGLSFWPEFVALSMQLKQSFVEKDSLTCRATFGSQPRGTGGGVVEERFPCGKDTSGMWFNGAVSAVGAEANSTFSASGISQADGYFQPGMLKWLTGPNAGQTFEIDGFGNPGNFSLAFETMFPISVGDTFQVRKDCTKWKEEPNGCKTHFGVDWVLHYRGEPYIPVSDADQLNMPGAAVGGALASSTFQTS